VAVLSLTVAEARGPVVWLGRDDGGAEGPVAHVVLDAAQGECRLRASLRVAGVVGARVWRLVEGRVWRLVEDWVSVAEAAPGSVVAVARGRVGVGGLVRRGPAGHSRPVELLDRVELLEQRGEVLVAEGGVEVLIFVDLGRGGRRNAAVGTVQQSAAHVTGVIRRVHMDGRGGRNVHDAAARAPLQEGMITEIGAGQWPSHEGWSSFVCVLTSGYPTVNCAFERCSG